jgi:hypothetical protein
MMDTHCSMHSCHLICIFIAVSRSRRSLMVSAARALLPGRAGDEVPKWISPLVCAGEEVPSCRQPPVFDGFKGLEVVASGLRRGCMVLASCWVAGSAGCALWCG